MKLLGGMFLGLALALAGFYVHEPVVRQWTEWTKPVEPVVIVKHEPKWIEIPNERVVHTGIMGWVPYFPVTAQCVENTNLCIIKFHDNSTLTNPSITLDCANTECVLFISHNSISDFITIIFIGIAGFLSLSHFFYMLFFASDGFLYHLYDCTVWLRTRWIQSFWQHVFDGTVAHHCVQDVRFSTNAERQLVVENAKTGAILLSGTAKIVLTKDLPKVPWIRTEYHHGLWYFWTPFVQRFETCRKQKNVRIRIASMDMIFVESNDPISPIVYFRCNDVHSIAIHRVSTPDSVEKTVSEPEITVVKSN